MLAAMRRATLGVTGVEIGRPALIGIYAPYGAAFQSVRFRNVFKVNRVLPHRDLRSGDYSTSPRFVLVARLLQ
jgi:hypothetical protein